MGFPQIGDNDDDAIALLRQIAENTGSMEGDQVDVSIDAAEAASQANLVPSGDLVSLENQRYSDGSIEPIEATADDLKPGDSVTVAEIKVPISDNLVGVSAVGASAHTADLDGDGYEESAVEYVYEVNKSSSGTGWQPDERLTSTVRTGTMSAPSELLPGYVFGPLQGFRLKVRNRTDDPDLDGKTIPGGQYGGRASIILYGGVSE